MNCKQGDRAVVVRPSVLLDLYTGRRIELVPNHMGYIVTCLQLMYDPVLHEYGWVIDRFLPWSADCGCGKRHSGMTNTLPDAHLRPLRDDEGDDETLQWAGKPHSVEEHR